MEPAPTRAAGVPPPVDVPPDDVPPEVGLEGGELGGELGGAVLGGLQKRKTFGEKNMAKAANVKVAGPTTRR